MKKLLLILLCLPMIGFGQCISGDCEDGYGTYTWADGDKYVGEYKDGNKSGQGTQTYYDGAKYQGEWKKGEKNGFGIYTFSDGSQWAGEFKDGKFIEE